MTFVDPYASLRDKHIADEEWEEVSGAMSCQHAGCYGVATIGKYNEKNKLLTWACPEGHLSKIEDYVL